MFCRARILVAFPFVQTPTRPEPAGDPLTQWTESCRLTLGFKERPGGR